MPKRNPFDVIKLEIVDEIVALRPKPGQHVEVPFGKEQLSARDYANRLFKMSPEERAREAKDMSVEDMMAVIERHRKGGGDAIDFGKPAPQPESGMDMDTFLGRR